MTKGVESTLEGFGMLRGLGCGDASCVSMTKGMESTLEGFGTLRGFLNTIVKKIYSKFKT
jgi:hypothetical protein